MTGFASKIFVFTAPNGEKSTISLNLKTLNTRFFDTTCKLPQSLAQLEVRLIKLFKKKLRRGHVYFTTYVSNPGIFQGSISPALATVEAYTTAIKEIKNRLHIPNDIALEHILRLPNIFNIEETTLDEKSSKILLDNIEELIEQVITTRKQEGSTLAKDIKKRLTLMIEEMEKIEQRAKIFIKEHKMKVHKTLQEIGADESLFAEAQKNSLYTMLDKIDIHEEIIRFNSHTEQFEQHLTSDDIEKGKRLDFILQELGREINTIAAKCSDATISKHAINVKVEIEKTREQVQNIV